MEKGHFNSSRIILFRITLMSLACIAIAAINPHTYYGFYKSGLLGLCTVPTYTQYTTNIADAIDFNPITQNYFYTTSVLGSCPYTVVYKSGEEGIIIGSN